MLAKTRNPYEPFATVIRICAGVYLAALPISLVSAALGWSHVFGLGQQQLCAVDSNIAWGADGGLTGVVRPGVNVSSVATSLCINHATLGQQLLTALTQVPGFVFYGVALVLLWWLLNGARRYGPFTAVNAHRVRFIGWWLIAGGIVTSSVARVAHNVLIGAMMQSSAAPRWFNNLPSLPVSAVLTGLGLIVIARIIRVGAQMNDDLAGTV